MRRLTVLAILWLAAVPPAAQAISEAEQRHRIQFETAESEARLARAGLLVGDPALDAYLQSVMDRLYPTDHYVVRAIRDVEANAFAVATGDVYVHLGLLLRVRSEAELAAVLGHEGAHVLRDHMYRRVVDAKHMGVFAATLNLGVPLLGSLIGYSSMAGFSRDLEREADRVGFERLVAAGYEPGAGAAVFQRMADEVAARKLKRSYFFADHPRLLERVQNMREFAAGAAPGEARRGEYLAATADVQRRTLETIHERKDGRALVALLSEAGRLEDFGANGEYLLAEGYRLRAGAGDEDLALAAYGRAIAAAPAFAAPYGARGRLLARRGERDGALSDLERFVELAPEARETPFARQTIDRLRQESPR